MSIDGKALGTANALIAAAVFTICSLAVAIAPGASSSFASYALHIDLTALSRQITWGSFVVGLVSLAAVFGGTGLAIAGLYNRLATGRVASSRA